MATTKPPWDEAKWEAEFLHLKVALAEAVAAWAALEDELAFLLSAMLDDYESDYGLAIYFVPAAAETRIQIVDVVFTRYFGTYLKGGLLAPWARFIDKLGTARKMRNKIAHGSLAKFHTGRKPVVRLTGTYMQDRKTASSKQLPGMSLNDVREASKSFNHFAATSRLLRNEARHARSDRKGKFASQQIVDALEAHLKTSSDRIVDPSLLGPEVRPSPFED